MDLTLTIAAAKAAARLLVMAAIGYIAAKADVLNENRTNTLSVLLMDIALPCMLIGLCFAEYVPERAAGFAWSLCWSTISQLFAALLSVIFISKKNNPDFGVERFSAAISNPGFIGIPIVSMVLGESACFYASGAVISCALLGWLFGYSELCGKFSLKTVLKGILNPMVIAIAAGLVIYFARIPVPSVITEPVKTVGSMSTTLAMLIAGATLARSNVIHALKKKNTYIVILIRHFAAPLILIPLIKMVNLPPEVGEACYIACATSAVTLCMAMAVKMNKNPYYASEIFTISFLLCLVTIPAMLVVYAALI